MTEQQNTSQSINLTIRFDTQRLEEMRKLASTKGMGVTTLVRMWVLERLEQERFREYAKQATK